MNFEETKDHVYVNSTVKFCRSNVQDKSSLKETRKRHKILITLNLHLQNTSITMKNTQKHQVPYRKQKLIYKDTLQIKSKFQ